MKSKLVHAITRNVAAQPFVLLLPRSLDFDYPPFFRPNSEDRAPPYIQPATQERCRRGSTANPMLVLVL